MIHLQDLAPLLPYTLVAGLLIVVACIGASEPMRRRRQRRHDLWLRRIRYTMARGGDSARGEP